MATPLPCRLCAAPLTRTFVDLGMSPLCETFIAPERVDAPEIFYPLHVRVCQRCLLVQLPPCVPPDQIFTDYAYFSSYSDSWVEHARQYATGMVHRLRLGPKSLVMEVASNDGYLLQHFVAAGVPVVGIDPAANVAVTARERGVPTVTQFLGADTARTIVTEYGNADLVVANNVLAHVPDLRDFVRGLRTLLADDGTLTLEFPHLLRLIEGRQYDTIYHEHYSYLSLLTAQRALANAGLVVLDVEELATHGGSLRLHVQPEGGGREQGEAVEALLGVEAQAGLHTADGHDGFAHAVDEVKRDLLDFLITTARENRRVVGYGAPGKGNTLLNHCGIRSDLLAYTVDRNPRKHGTLLPGSRIPVHSPDQLAVTRPDFVLLLPWNLRAEIAAQLSYVRDWGARLVVAVPQLEIF